MIGRYGSTAGLSSPGADHPPYRADIDGLRAVAILSVVVCHAFPALLPGGYIGVDVFFVLSGYLITSILVKGLRLGTFSIRDFYTRRVNRLFPALSVVLIATLAMGYRFQLPGELVSLGWQAIAGAAFAANLYFWHDTGYFTGLGEGNPLLHLWSLGIEEQFYLVWPILLYVSYRRAWRIEVVLAITVVASFVYSVYAVNTDATAAFYSPLSRFWELGAGGILAVRTLSPASPRQASELRFTVLGIVAIAMILAAAFLFSPKTAFPGAWAAVPVAATLALLASKPTAWVNRRILATKPMVAVGLISYPLYLWHWPLLAFVRAQNDDASIVAMRNATILAMVVAGALAWLTYRYLEVPLRRVRKSRVKVAALLGAMVACCIVGFAFIVTHGLPYRIPKEVRAYAKADLRDDTWMATLRGGVCHNMVYTYRTLGDPATCFPEGAHPRVMLWGDSHAAALYSGLHLAARDRAMSLWQITTDASAPFFDDSLKNNMHRSLAWVNDQVLSRMETSPPDIIVLHATWAAYRMKPEDVVRQVIESVDRIKKELPTTRIVVLGPVPTWNNSIQSTLVSYAVHKHHALPATYLDYGLSKQPFEVDRDLAKALPKNGITYISAISQLCSSAGCVFRVGNGIRELAYVDSSHLSSAGSAYLASRIVDKIVGVGATPRTQAP